LISMPLSSRPAPIVMTVDQSPDGAPLDTLNEVYSLAVPFVGQIDLMYDTASITYDPQERVLETPFMRMSQANVPPKDKWYYPSRLKALNVTKRQQTTQETLSALCGRNFGAPQISRVQDRTTLIPEIWENFLDVMCVSDARDKLKLYQSQPAALDEEYFADWMQQASSSSLATMRSRLEADMQAFEKFDVSEFEFMIKADVKPTLSTKPIQSHVNPQVIVHHVKELGALYSSIFRLLVRRLLSIIRPNIHVNLLKDTVDIAAFVRAYHPCSDDIEFLENDFSQYDKSQGVLVFDLESYVFEQLGLHEELLGRWMQGHIRCSARSIALGMSFSVMYQRKSGDATTAFGNVLLNVLAVAYAYRGTQYHWGVFMGDDSLIAVKGAVYAADAIQILAEVFNLTAKFYVTRAPYFASNFVIIDADDGHVALLPDPIKRIERWSMLVGADDPHWEDKYQSVLDTCGGYAYTKNTHRLGTLVAQRYNIPVAQARRLGPAIYSITLNAEVFRSVWDNKAICLHH